jgi:hypothetical protein
MPVDEEGTFSSGTSGGARAGTVVVVGPRGAGATAALEPGPLGGCILQ